MAIGYDPILSFFSVAARCALGLLVAATIACGDGEPRAAADSASFARTEAAARVRQDSIDRARPDYVVDSILPIDEEIRRFRAEFSDSLTELAGGAPSRDALVLELVRAIEGRDTARLDRLLVTRQEFADLVYPGSRFTRPPLRTKPGVLWMLLANENAKAGGRLLDRLGGAPLGFVGYACRSAPEVENGNRTWSDCHVSRLRASGDTARERLFASIIERGGRFKIRSLANGF